MSAIQSILVPKISSLPEAEARARLMLRWLAGQRLVAAQQSTCGRLGNGMAHAINEGARRLPHAERLGYPLAQVQVKR